MIIAKKERVFHWEFVFPEVFEYGGFSAFVGNPPFIGGKRISTMFGDEYLSYLRSAYPSSTGAADLCAFFFLRSFGLGKKNSTLGLIATNTIAQGDTRETGLDYLINSGGTIYSANPSNPWPGVAAVYVSVVHLIRGEFLGNKFLAEKLVEVISASLDEKLVTKMPNDLQENSDKSYVGSYVLGMGFILSVEESSTLMSKNPKNKDVVFPYLSGEDLNKNPDQSPNRWAINFFDWALEKAEEYPECIERIRTLVKPEREKVKRDRHRERWWIYAENRPGLYNAISKLSSVLVMSRYTKYLSWSFSNTQKVFSDSIIVLALDDYSSFVVVSSSIHNEWAWKFSSTMGDETLRYSPSDAFQKFPFPRDLGKLKQIGESYYEHRRQIMLARQEGLTSTYNRVHNPKESAEDILRLRELHVEMDRAVASAYGWDDLELGHGFHETAQGIRYTISESARREVLSRLLKLNHERYEEEQSANASRQRVENEKKAKSKKVKNSSSNEGQMGLL